MRYQVIQEYDHRYLIRLSRRALAVSLGGIMPGAHAPRTPGSGQSRPAYRDSPVSPRQSSDLWQSKHLAGSLQKGPSEHELVYHRQCSRQSEATKDIVEYIEMIYNRKHRHSTLGYQSPAEYEAWHAVA